MAEDNGSSKPFKNSLLSAAATGFSFEDSATLLVPVSLDEPALVTPAGVDDDANSEINLNSDEAEDDTNLSFSEGTPVLLPVASSESGPQHINIFSTSGNTPAPQDDFSALLTSSGLSSKAAEQQSQFSFSSLWSSASGKWNSSTSTAETAHLSNPHATVSGPQTSIMSGMSSGGGMPPQQHPMLIPSHPATMDAMPSIPMMSVPPPTSSQMTTTSMNSTSFNSNGSYTPTNSISLLPPLPETKSTEIVSTINTSVPASAAVLPPTGNSGQSKGNSFRLGSQRPTYAQYPGLMGATSPTSSSVPNFPPTGPPIPDMPTPQMQPVGNVFTPPAPTVNQMAQESLPPITSYFQTQSAAPAMPVMESPINFAPSTSFSQSPSMSSFPRSASQQTFTKPLSFHWFYRKEIDARPMWRPFSVSDSALLEEAFLSGNAELIAADGGRYDVDVHKRKRFSIYWEEAPSEVRRCSWFYKGPNDSRYVPYEEELAERLESEFQQAITTGTWNRRLEFGGGEAIVLYNPNAMSHFCQAAAPDEWGNLPESQLRPRVVKRGVDEFEIDDGESTQIDHLVFLVHGIGAICDFKFRTIEEAVDDFRHLSHQLMHTHFKESVDSNRAGRIEFLPVSWHKALHGDGGIDQKLKPITLKSIPRLRNFTNDTLLDILFYTSPVYAQTIVETVGKELNRLFNLFLTRNPTFNGHVALAGHSLGSLILFDLLAHQPEIGRHTKPPTDEEPSATKEASEEEVDAGASGDTANESPKLSSRMVSYTVGSGTGQPHINYPVLEFEPTIFFALGSPIAMFVTVRGIDRLEESFHFPTCPAFFNIFHPYDPVAYRIETLIDPACESRPVLIPHHKGRKRLHLELKETMQRVGADIKQKFLDSLKTTWNTVYQYATFSKGENFEQEMDRVIQGELVKKSVDTASNGSGDEIEQDVGPGQLNGGRRIDYVLQEAPFESFNEYLFALSSHVCYWESEDTMLMIMKEIYASMGIFMEQQKILPPQPGQILNPRHSIGPTYSQLPYNMGDRSQMQKTPSPISFLNPSQQNMNTVGPPPLLLNPGGNFTNHSQQSFVPTPFTSSETNGPVIIGARPVVSPEALNSLRGMDPTAPITNPTSIGPPPLTGFQRKN